MHTNTGCQSWYDAYVIEISVNFDFQNYPDQTPKAPKVSMKRSRDVDITPNPKTRRHRAAMRALTLTNLTPPSKLKGQERLASSSGQKFDIEDPLMVPLNQTNGKPTRCVDLSYRGEIILIINFWHKINHFSCISFCLH